MHIDPNLSDDAVLQQLVTSAYDIEEDDRAMRRLITLPAAERGAWFDGLRKRYRVRREFAYYRVELPRQRETVAALLERLGFSVIREQVRQTSMAESEHG
jgi:hypothetical protein